MLFPRMSRLAGRNDMTGLRDTLEYGLEYLFVLLVPSAVAMSAMSRAVVVSSMLMPIFMIGSIQEVNFPFDRGQRFLFFFGLGR
ncbi:MAG: hypothetical protein HC888_11880 [Candidatus Competibacteraceae bacterium]|nr:hypothetical protein [Candidatus Competibacteraceae bacterium]